MPPSLGTLPRHLLAGRRKTFDAEGCRVCGAQRSSSFRKCLSTGARLCNSCHCKLYRRKRKEQQAAAAADRAAHSDGSASSAAALPPLELGGTADCGGSMDPAGLGAGQGEASWAPVSTPDQFQDLPARMSGPLGSSPPPSTPPALRPPPASALLSPVVRASPHSPQHAQQPHPHLSALQWQALREEGIDVPTTLVCARHAQAATAGCVQRTVLGVLPRLDLRLPGDPPGMRHPVACLLEVVLPAQTRPRAAEQECDSAAAAAAAPPPPPDPPALRAQPGGGAAAAARRVTRQAQRHTLAARLAPLRPQVVVRMTVFGAAGAVARWHQAPAISIPSPMFSPVSGEPTWSNGPTGFCLCFPSAASPQLELFNAIRVFASAVGAAALQQPTVELSPAAGPPLPSSPFADLEDSFSLPMELELEASGLAETEAGGSAGWSLPLGVALPTVAVGRPCSPAAGTPQHRAPPPTPAAAQQAQQLQREAVSEWPSLQALLLSEPEQPQPGLGGGAAAGGVPVCEGGAHEAGSEAASGPAAAALYARDDADPLARFSLGDNLSLSCSLGPSDPLFDASCLDFLCTEAC